MSIETHPIGWPVDQITMATWWPGLDFEFEESAAGGVVLGRATEIESANPVRAIRVVPVGCAVETDVAPTFKYARFFKLGVALEIDQGNPALVLQPGLGQVTRYITAELVDRNEVTRTNVYRDLINYSIVPDKILFTTRGAVDVISYSSHTDRIFFSRAA